MCIRDSFTCVFTPKQEAELADYFTTTEAQLFGFTIVLQNFVRYKSQFFLKLILGIMYTILPQVWGKTVHVAFSKKKRQFTRNLISKL